jgi:hypothetical protein
MITVNDPHKTLASGEIIDRTRPCSVCHETNDIKLVNFRENEGGAGTQLALCVDCRRELREQLDGC